MSADFVRDVEPFAMWPDRASAVRGLGGAQPGKPSGYVFHSDYLTTRGGTIQFSGQFSGLVATRGILRLSVLALPIAREKASQVARVEIPLARLAAEGGRWEVSLDARADASHAIVGDVIDATDAVADGLVIGLDGWGDGTALVTALKDARETMFSSPSAVGRNWWKPGSAVERAGLISSERATLADPSSQMCTASQMHEPAYARWLGEIRQPFVSHRKQWEFVYILAVLEAQGRLTPGMRGLGFGCGIEFLPALLAARGCSIVASDMPQEMQAAGDWIGTNQHANSLEQLQRPDMCSPDVFDRNVSFREVDMTAIPADLRDFDFCWSACAYEHLGSIEAGLRFVRNSVECLRPGGVAVHTSELNLLSNDATIDNLATVLFRRRDMERLALELTRDGHRVLPLKYDQGDQPLDQHIDVPPYSSDAHLKLALGRFVTTSFGIVVIRGEG